MANDPKLSLSARGLLIAGLIALVFSAALVGAGYWWGHSRKAVIPAEVVRIVEHVDSVKVQGKTEIKTRTVEDRHKQDSLRSLLDIAQFRMEEAEKELWKYAERISRADTTVQVKVMVLDASDSVLYEKSTPLKLTSIYHFPPMNLHEILYDRPEYTVRTTLPPRQAVQMTGWEKAWDAIKTGSVVTVVVGLLALTMYSITQ